MIRAVVIALACGVAASTAGAAAPLARNGLIAFSRAQGDNIFQPHIYVISARGSKRRQVSPDTTYTALEWSPDGKRVAYSTGGSVIVTSVDGGVKSRFSVGEDRGEPVDLDWSPDGKRIAVTAGPLYVKTLGGPLKRLTRRSAHSPAWSPDSGLIAYIDGRLFDGQLFRGRLFVVRADGRERRRLGTSPGVMDAPSWSPNGRRIVVGMEGALYVVDVQPRRSRRIVRRTWSEDPLWSPNGEWIAFTRARASDKPGDVYLVRPDGSGLRRLTRTPHYEYSLTWSPSGRRLAYAGRRGDVFVVDLGARHTRRISRTKCGERAGSLKWSPRGGLLAFRSVAVRRDAEIVTAKDAATDIRPLTRDCNVWEYNPAWSPRGDELAYDRYGPMGRSRVRERHIYIARKDGSGVRRVTSNPSGGEDPTWSPDAEQLAFWRRLGDYDTELFVISRDGTGERRLTNTPGLNFAPAWSPVDNRIAFASSRDGSVQIYVMNADGSGAVRLTDAGGTDPDWSPDGARIVFIRGCNIWTMKADGTDPARLAVGNVYCDSVLSPAWSPDGTQIAFSADVDGGRGSQYALFVVDAADGTHRSFIFDNQDNLEPDWQPVP